MRTPLRLLFRPLQRRIRFGLEYACRDLPRKNVGPVGDTLTTRYKITDDALGDLARGLGVTSPGVLSRLPAVRARLHRHRRGDKDVELHNHPYLAGLSLLLVGAYDETLSVGGGAERTRRLSAGDLNFIGPRVFHRLALASTGDVWTFFLQTKDVRSWGFRGRGGAFIAEEDFEAYKHAEAARGAAAP